MQRRSRERVDLIMRTAADIVMEDGVEAVTTKEIALRAGIPASAIYGYFADVDEIIGELVTRNMERLDEQMFLAIATLERVSIRSLIGAMAHSYVLYHRERPENIPIWFNSRNPAVRQKVDERIQRLAAWVDRALNEANMLEEPFPRDRIEMIVDAFNSLFDFLYQRKYPSGEREAAIRQFVDMVSSYVERFATPAGLEGIPRNEFFDLIGEADGV